MLTFNNLSVWTIFWFCFQASTYHPKDKGVHVKRSTFHHHLLPLYYTFCTFSIIWFWIMWLRFELWLFLNNVIKIWTMTPNKCFENRLSKRAILFVILFLLLISLRYSILITWYKDYIRYLLHSNVTKLSNKSHRYTAVQLMGVKLNQLFQLVT